MDTCSLSRKHVFKTAGVMSDVFQQTFYLDLTIARITTIMWLHNITGLIHSESIISTDSF